MWLTTKGNVTTLKPNVEAIHLHKTLQQIKPFQTMNHEFEVHCFCLTARRETVRIHYIIPFEGVGVMQGRLFYSTHLKTFCVVHLQHL